MGRLPSSPAPLPVTDWQFWVVTAIALVAGAWIVHRLMPARFRARRRASGAKRATLTVGGRAVERSRGGADHH